MSERDRARDKLRLRERIADEDVKLVALLILSKY